MASETLSEAAVPRFARVMLVVFLPFACGYFFSYLYRSVNAVVTRTFGDAGPDAFVVYVDSAGRVALAVNGGSAAADFDATLGDQVLVLFARP